MELQFGTIFEAMSDEFGSTDALVHGDVRYSWTEFNETASRFGGFLADLGVGSDQKVGLFLYNSPEYLIAQFGAFKQRCVPINVNYRYLDDELCYLLDNADVEVLVYHSSLEDRVARIASRLPRIRAFVVVADSEESPVDSVDIPGRVTWSDMLAGSDSAPRQRRSGDDIYMLYTGGTTGMPKGVMFRQEDFLRRLFAGYMYRGWQVPNGPEDLLVQVHAHQDARRVSIPACPLMHGTGMWLGALYIHLMGGTCVTLPGRSFDADQLWQTVEREGADAVTIVGDAFSRPMVQALDRAVAEGRPYDISTLRIVQSSGVMFTAETQQGLLHHADIRIVDSMGSTEIAMGRRIATRTSSIETAVFAPIAGTIVIDEAGKPVEPGSGQTGRVAASLYVPLGYFKDPEKSAATFPEIDGKRYALAGDWGTVTAEGNIVLLGRGSNCINTAGEKVYPEEVEEAVKRFAPVADCLVVGLPDERFGQRIAAVVSAHSGHDLVPEELLADLRTRLSAYKLPREIKVVAEVKRAPNGKADYGWAKNEFATGE